MVLVVIPLLTAMIPLMPILSLSLFLLSSRLIRSEVDLSLHSQAFSKELVSGNPIEKMIHVPYESNKIYLIQSERKGNGQQNKDK